MSTPLSCYEVEIILILCIDAKICNYKFLHLYMNVDVLKGLFSYVYFVVETFFDDTTLSTYIGYV